MIKVLMLGWEFPPYFAGGVGMVCYEVTKALSKRDDVSVTYVMPYGPKDVKSHVDIIVLNNLISNMKINLIKVPSLLSPYITGSEYQNKIRNFLRRNSEGTLPLLYGRNLLEEVLRFKEKIKILVQNLDFDVVHANDWTTFPAAIAIKELTGKPIIVHVHITEFNKSGGLGVNPYIYAIEKEGMEKADKVIAVSNLIKNLCVNNYGIDPNKIVVIHNAPNEMKTSNIDIEHIKKIKKDNKIVLFAGRVTLQKGPEYFVYAAKKVLEIEKNVKFLMAGDGDKLQEVIRLAINLGIADHFIFHGFYTREEAEMLFSLADVFVMPSVSEPFGLVPFEAMAKQTPVIISKQSGCSEVINHALKVDFWDTEEMANMIISLLRYKPLHQCLSRNGHYEVYKYNWDDQVNKIVDLYKTLSVKSL